MSTQNKDNSTVKGQTRTTPETKGNTTTDTRGGNATIKGDDQEEKRKGHQKPSATTKANNTGKPNAERDTDAKRPTTTTSKKN